MMERARLATYVDFYGQLLTKKQQRVIDLHINEDFSLSEIADQVGSSRQAVHDMLGRTIQKLEEYEAALGLYRLLQKHEDQLERIKQLLQQMGVQEREEYHKILAIMDEIIY